LEVFAQGLSGVECRDRGIGEIHRNCREMIHMASGNDMKAAEQTYDGFIAMVKWGSIVVAITTVIVIALIA
jgi:Bacterial aa3 type cytochrome c oxidase subunit IV